MYLRTRANSGLAQQIHIKCNVLVVRMYGFAVMEVDLNPQPESKHQSYAPEIMELLKNADGLCYVGSLVIQVLPFV